MATITVLPLCFVLMPFGKKAGLGGATIDFDAVYTTLIEPAIRDAAFEPLRADEEQVGGIIHKPMFERLVLCEFAVADLSTANANVFYELGLRHGVKPYSTTLIFAEGAGPLPFDVAPLRGLPYALGADGKPAQPERDRSALLARLKAARGRLTDSPVWQLVDGYPDIQHLKTDVFRERVAYAKETKGRLAIAREAGRDAVHAVETDVTAVPGGLGDVEAGVVVDLFLSYRATKAWGDMIALAARMSAPLAATTMIREQLGFALNRAGRADEAERVLLDLIATRGPSSETCGILGRVYKDRWEAARAAEDAAAARGWMKRAIGMYLMGFETDWRDAYPGVNAVTLMEIAEPPDPRRQKLIPVVSYSVDRRIATGRPDYWDYATRLELAVLANDEQVASDALDDALAAVKEKWQPETTCNNLRFIRQAREPRGTATAWAAAAEESLRRKAAG